MKKCYISFAEEPIQGACEMRRLISVCLVLVLSLVLSSPAFAVDEEEYYDYYQDKFWVSEDYEYYIESPEMQEWISDWVEQNPEWAAEILADDPPLWEELGFESLEDFMLINGLETEEDYHDFLLVWYVGDYYYDYLREQEEAEAIKNTRLSMGGTREGLAVMFNDTYISFPGAQPENINGNTMVPFRSLIEAFGGQVGYDSEARQITASLGSFDINFVIGSYTLEAVAAGEERMISMDCASYAKNGVAYVPLRHLCNLIGYDTYWDSTYETAVILDPSSIISEINENFSVLNKLFVINNALDPLKTYKTVGEVLVSYTELNSLDGDQTAVVTLNIRALQNGMNQQMTLMVDLSQILEMLMGTDDDYLDDETIALLNGASELSMDMILNYDDECMYIKTNLYEMLGAGVDGDTWVMYGSDYFGAMIGEYDELLGSGGYYPFNTAKSATVGSYIYDSVAGSYEALYNYDTVFIYSDIFDAAEELAMLSDSMFIKNGNTYTLCISLDNCDTFLTALDSAGYNASFIEDLPYEYREFDFTLNITDRNGTISTSGSFNLRSNPDYTYTDARISGSFSISAQEVSVDIEFHQKNEMKLRISADFTVTETNQSVLKAPPEGSTVIDADALEQIQNKLYVGEYY